MSGIYGGCSDSGAALAQDRGSLEAKVKSLTTQVTDLRLQTQVCCMSVEVIPPMESHP